METRIADRIDVVEKVDRLFVATDRKDWAAVQALFTERVAFDMSSLGSGAPAVLTAQEIVERWRDGLKDVQALHHQSGNYIVSLSGDTAEVFCYATATHYRPEQQKRLTQFVGSYELRLVRLPSGWRIDRFKFDRKWVE
jgi:hypothetical protein